MNKTVLSNQGQISLEVKKPTAFWFGLGFFYSFPGNKNLMQNFTVFTAQQKSASFISFKCFIDVSSYNGYGTHRR